MLMCSVHAQFTKSGVLFLSLQTSVDVVIFDNRNAYFSPPTRSIAQRAGARHSSAL